MQDAIENLKIAKRGPIVSIIAYLILSVSKLATGYFINSSSLIADGFNNLSDIVDMIGITLIGFCVSN